MLRRDHFIVKLIKLLIRKLNNCSLGGDFRVSPQAEIWQFDRFSLEINLKRARSCNYEFPAWVQVKKYTILMQFGKSPKISRENLFLFQRYLTKITKVGEKHPPGLIGGLHVTSPKNMPTLCKL